MSGYPTESRRSFRYRRSSGYEFPFVAIVASILRSLSAAGPRFHELRDPCRTWGGATTILDPQLNWESRTPLPWPPGSISSSMADQALLSITCLEGSGRCSRCVKPQGTRSHPRIRKARLVKCKRNSACPLRFCEVLEDMFKIPPTP